MEAIQDVCVCVRESSCDIISLKCNELHWIRLCNVGHNPLRPVAWVFKQNELLLSTLLRDCNKEESENLRRFSTGVMI